MTYVRSLLFCCMPRVKRPFARLSPPLLPGCCRLNAVGMVVPQRCMLLQRA